MNARIESSGQEGRRYSRLAEVPQCNCLLTGVLDSGAPVELPEDITAKVIVIGRTAEGVDGMLDTDAIRSGQYTIKAFIVTAAPPEVPLSPRQMSTVRSRLQDIPGITLHNQPVYGTGSLIAQLYAHYRRTANDAADVPDTDDLKAQARLRERFDRLVATALEEEASDIHLTVHDDQAEISLRVHTRLEPLETLTAQEAQALQRATYNTLADEKSRGDAANVDAEYQNASIERILDDGSKVRIRYASAPLDDGWKVVLRLLTIGKRDDIDLTFEQLGYARAHAEMLREIFAMPTGLLVLAGVTGSGKTTTIKHGLRRIIRARPELAVYTIEEPVEYRIKGAEQISVVRSGDGEDPFAQALRALMRLDPDVVMVGEMRDPITAHLASNAALTGHKVLTTVHASSGVEVVPRLAGSGLQVSPDILGAPNFISGIVYQALVPTLCPHCREPVDIAAWRGSSDPDRRELAQRLAGAAKFCGGRLYHSSGKSCGAPKCRHGTNGVTVAAEVIVPDAPMRAAFRAADYGLAEELWIKQRQVDEPDNFRGRSALEHAIRKMLDGLLSPVDVEMRFGFIPSALLAEYAQHYCGVSDPAHRNGEPRRHPEVTS